MIDAERSALASRYHRFAVREARGKSALYEQLGLKVAADPIVLARIADLPLPKQQPNLLLAAYRHRFGVPSDYAEFRTNLLEQFDAVRDIILERSTQTNEPNRCAVLLPILASLPQPLALLEVGASAGLCLFPDRYGYDYPSRSLRPVGRTRPYPVFPCESDEALRIPDALPQIVWRAGLDLNPLNAADPDEAAWLETLVWPEQEDRLARLRLALDIAAEDKPMLVRGDLLGPAFEGLCRQAPQGATLVVFHTAVLGYVSAVSDRAAFANRALASADVWICNEGPSVVPGLAPVSADAPPRDAFLVSVNGRPTAWADPHGTWMQTLVERPSSVPASGVSAI